MENNINQYNSADNEKDMEQIYEWVDSVPLTRMKKNITRDFCDGVLIAELVKNHIPKIVELHNYSSACSATQKNYNWVTLNQKVFKRLGFQISKSEIQDIINCKPGVIENLLKKLNKHIQKFMAGDINLSKNLNSNVNINMSGEDDEGNRNSKKHKEISYGEYDGWERVRMMKALKQKDSQIEELKNIVDILEMKLNNSGEIQQALEKRINQLKEMLKEYGHI